MSAKSSRLAVIGVGAAMILTGIAGCGGSDDEASGPLSKEDFIAQADEICAKGKADSAASQTDFQKAIAAEDFDAAADALEANAEIMSSSFDEIESLEAPEGDQDTIEEFTAIGQQQADGIATIAGFARENDQESAAAESKKLDQLAKRSNELTAGYGFADCSNESDNDDSKG